MSRATSFWTRPKAGSAPVELRVDLDERRLIEAAASLSMGAAWNRQLRHTILGELAFGGAASRAGFVGDDQADAADARVGDQLGQGDGGCRMNRKVGTALRAVLGRIRRLGPADGAVAQSNLLSTAGGLYLRHRGTKAPGHLGGACRAGQVPWCPGAWVPHCVSTTRCSLQPKYHSLATP